MGKEVRDLDASDEKGAMDAIAGNEPIENVLKLRGY